MCSTDLSATRHCNSGVTLCIHRSFGASGTSAVFLHPYYPVTKHRSHFRRLLESFRLQKEFQTQRLNVPVSALTSLREAIFGAGRNPFKRISPTFRPVALSLPPARDVSGNSSLLPNKNTTQTTPCPQKWRSRSTTTSCGRSRQAATWTSKPIATLSHQIDAPSLTTSQSGLWPAMSQDIITRLDKVCPDRRPTSTHSRLPSLKPPIRKLLLASHRARSHVRFANVLLDSSQ